jgi:DNA invertase Pin-like site-specific DNA recombinase
MLLRHDDRQYALVFRSARTMNGSFRERRLCKVATHYQLPVCLELGILYNRSMGQVFAYARVSTDQQDLDPQTDELRRDGFDVLVVEKASGANRNRPELARLVRDMRAGDVLKVVRIDRLARSVSHLLEVIETLERKGAHFRSLRDPIDTTTPQGMFSLQVLGAVAQLERALIADRSKAGLASARARGRVGGNPGVRAGDPAAIAKIVKSMDETYVTRLIDQMETFMPAVRRLRPAKPWAEVAAAVSKAAGVNWTVKRLHKSVRRLVAEGLADRKVLGRAERPRRRRSDELAAMVRGMRLLQPKISLRAIGAQLEAMGQLTPRGQKKWSATSVALLLERLPPESPHAVS